ncbi:MAG: hypothetical protein U0Q16_30965 [Bryobacteraceae bacterium]
MRTCTNCQAPLFEEPACIICGKPASETLSPPSAAPSPASGAGALTIEQLRSQSTSQSSHYVIAFCYLFLALSGLIMLLWPGYRTNKHVRFHAVQSILLTPLWLWVFCVTAMFGPEEYRDKLLWIEQIAMLSTWFFMVGISAAGRSVSLPILGYLARKEL